MRIKEFGSHHKSRFKNIDIDQFSNLKLTKLVKKFKNWKEVILPHKEYLDYFGIHPHCECYGAYENQWGTLRHSCRRFDTVIYFKYGTGSIEGIVFETQDDADYYWKEVLKFNTQCFKCVSKFKFMDKIQFYEDYYSEFTELTYSKNEVYEFYAFNSENTFMIIPIEGFNLFDIHIPGYKGSKRFIADRIPINKVKRVYDID